MYMMKLFFLSNNIRGIQLTFHILMPFIYLVSISLISVFYDANIIKAQEQPAAAPSDAYYVLPLIFPDKTKAATVAPAGWTVDAAGASLTGPGGVGLVLESRLAGSVSACQEAELAAAFIDFPSDATVKTDAHARAAEWTAPRGADDACLAFIVSARGKSMVVRAVFRARGGLYTLRTGRLVWDADMDPEKFAALERDINIISNYFYLDGADGYKQLLKIQASGQPLRADAGADSTAEPGPGRTNNTDGGSILNPGDAGQQPPQGSNQPPARNNDATLPRDADLLRADKLKNKGKYEDAEAIYLGLMAKVPYDAHTGLGDVYARTGRYDEAVRHLQEAMILRPEAPEAYNGLGSVYFYQGDYESAEKYFNQALEKDEENTTAMTNLGWVALARGDIAGADTQFSRALITGPDPATIIGLYLGMAQVALARGQYDNALLHADEILQREPENAAAYAVRATADSQLGDHGNALVAAMRAADLDPAMHQFHALVAFETIALGKFDEAEAAFRKAIDAAPADAPELPDYYIGLARSFFQRGNLDQAENILTNAIKQFPGNQALAAALQEVREKKTQ